MVATLNLRKGEARWGERAPLLMEQLVALRPDIVGFQEIDLRIDQGNWLRQRFNDFIEGSGAPEYKIHHMANPRERVSLEALGIMTNLPVVAHEGLDYLFRNRVAHRIRVDLGGSLLDFYNTHFHHEQDVPGNQVRREQAEKLLAWMGSHGWDVPKVLVGDFNSPPGTRPVRIISERLSSAFETAHGHEPDATIPTPLIPPNEWPKDWPRGVTVDYIFVSPSLTVTDARRVFDTPHPSDPTLYPSDHYGLTATIEIAELVQIHRVTPV
ncbi:MAG: endonuclease/exonuclease/phosphatase family protein [Chloroflexi bacterium]|nr:endonuclease/exonuclease/phosphatase family protein [Chloroflexota bacterium]